VSAIRAGTSSCPDDDAVFAAIVFVAAQSRVVTVGASTCAQNVLKGVEEVVAT